MSNLDKEKELEDKLRNSLYNLKENLQDKNYNFQSGRRPIICSDDVIEALVRYKPKNIEDMSKIRGIGDNFIQNYAQEFLKIINQNAETLKIELNEKEKTLLGKLENRLVNINKRNRLLYSSKVNKDYGIDTYRIIENLKEFEEFIVERKNTAYKIIEIGDFEDEKLKLLLKLIRQVDKIINETGNNELYIAYPFVQGKMENEDFNVKAPLIFFPVEIIRDNKSISIKNDFSRDIIYNTNLILANNKFNGKNEILPSNKIEDYNNEKYIENMIEFYSNNNLYISKTDFKQERFLENTVSNFPKYKNGELEIKGYMVLGIYSMSVTSIFSDFHKMIENNNITNLIKDLLNGCENFGNDYSYQELENTETTNSDYIENDIYYINELDFSQEKVLKEIKHTNSLVVQGPPGTGKSQTITSLIIQSILDNKRVLMVSEKKTALDVIYSRLGELSRFALLIDDVENKDLFYKQLNKLLNTEDINELIDRENLLDIHNDPIKSKEQIKSYIKNIDSELTKLNKIAQKIYSINDFGTSYYNLYNTCKNIKLNDDKEYELYNTTNNLLTKTINEAKYNEVKNTKTFFDNINNINSILEYLKISNEHSYVLDIMPNLTELELIEFRKDLVQLEEFKKQYDTFNFIKKMFEKSKLEELLKNILKKYFYKKPFKELKDLILNDIKFLIEFVDKLYTHFFNNKYLYDKLNLLEIDYSNVLYKLHTIENDRELGEYNNYIYNVILYNKITQFEKNNSDILNYVNNFETIIKEIRKNIIDKKNYTKRLAYLTLIINMLKLDYNGNLNKIEEMCNRKRKMSVGKFMDKFKLEMLDSTRIWLMTPEVVSDIFPFEKNVFDLLIFDEASQLYVEKSIPAIYRAKKVIIAGDQQQLKPSCLGKGRILDDVDENEIDDGFLEYESLLDAANYKYKHTMLNYHYRSRYSELISFSNYAFYNGKLLVSSSPKYSKEPPIERIMVKNGRWIDKKNIAEAEQVVKLVKDIMSSRKNNETIGVITFNISQMNLIEEYLEKEKLRDEKFAITMNTEEHRTENGENVGFFVKNIESVQGDERDIIIFCIGYAKNEQNRVAINFGWLNQDGGENRLNVAISRAKNKIYVITSIEPEDLVVDNTKNSGPKLFKEYLKYAKAISENNSELAESILLSLLDSKDTENGQLTYDSVFEEEVCNKLLDAGYNISTQYGVGGYRIDIVVKSKDGKNILLGIECDGRLYHSSKFARERDYHRQKYLESRGWKIYRLWSTNWWKNSEAEMEKLKKYINSLE
ncbi:MAG: DUF4011 domain-containing protein [Clostridia bacterium]|nr:DUF4011 domain-containing protein [Clostridia bacterium]